MNAFGRLYKWQGVWSRFITRNALKLSDWRRCAHVWGNRTHVGGRTRFWVINICCEIFEATGWYVNSVFLLLWSFTTKTKMIRSHFVQLKLTINDGLMAIPVLILWYIHLYKNQEMWYTKDSQLSILLWTLDSGVTAQQINKLNKICRKGFDLSEQYKAQEIFTKQ